MDLFSIDKFSELKSPIHRLNPAVSLVSFLAFVIVVALVPQRSFVPLYVALASLFCVALVSRVPLGFMLRRSLTVIPFALAIGGLNLLAKGAESVIHHPAATYLNVGSGGVRLFLNMILKSFVCVLSMTLLVSTTGSAGLLSAMRKIGVPAGLTVGTCFLSRYFSVVADELLRMKRSRESRRAGKLPLITELRYIGTLIGVLFIRSYERAERIYVAMCSRGFDGVVVAPIRSGSSKADFVFPIFLLGPLLLSLLRI